MSVFLSQRPVEPPRGARAARAWRALEHGLDRVCGEPDNPLRQLGGLGFYLFWLIAPEKHHEGGAISLMEAISWMDVVIPVALFALWIGLYMQQLRQRPLLPVHDPQFEEALGPAFAHADNPGTAH